MLRQPSLWVAAALLLAAAVSGSAAAAQDPVYTGTFSDLAVSGCDPVAYFADGKPAEGSCDYSYQWNGATWRFASPAHLDQFKADPARYAPQFGGYCAWAVSQGYTASADPQAWRIVDGKLYLNYNCTGPQFWDTDLRLRGHR